MSRVVTHGPTNTPVGDPQVDVDLSDAALNFGIDFAAVEDEPGLLLLTDLTCPVNQPSTIRLTSKVRPNVYAGTAVDPSMYAVSRQGIDNYCEVKEVWAVTETEDTTFMELLPVRCSIALSYPSHASITESDLIALLARTVASLAAADGALNTGIVRLMHHVVVKD